MQVDREAGGRWGDAGRRSLQAERHGVGPFDGISGSREVSVTDALQRPDGSRKLIRRNEEIDIRVHARSVIRVQPLGRHRTLEEDRSDSLGAQDRYAFRCCRVEQQSPGNASDGWIRCGLWRHSGSVAVSGQRRIQPRPVLSVPKMS
jgi:hypothetical protein